MHRWRWCVFEGCLFRCLYAGVLEELGWNVGG